MTKMHLPAKPANEGARLLAWWLHSRPTTVSFATSVLHTQAGLREPMLDRLIGGEIIPGADMGHKIWLATNGKVPTRTWRQDPHGGWFDRPSQFQEQEARGIFPLLPARAGGVCPPFRASPAPVQETRA